MKIERFSGSREEWNAALGRLEGGTFCHRWEWKLVLREAFGHESFHWVARDAGGDIVGLLPLGRVKSLLFGDNLISMPFLNYGGAIGSEEARRALGAEAVRFATELGAGTLELRSRRPPPLDLPVFSDKAMVLLDLPEDSEALWEDGLKSKVRSQVRRPMKAGMTARFGHDQVDAFYAVFCRNMRDLGTPVLPRSFFTHLLRFFGETAIVCGVYKDDVAVAAGLGFLHQGEFEITWASANRDYSREAPNMLLYWALMEEAIRRGADVFNFGRSTPGSGTHRFKLQWGGRSEDLHWARWSPSGDVGRPGEDKSRLSLAIRAWQRFPLPVANALGPLISPSIPTW